MEPRARTRTLLRRAGISAALAALLLPAAAGTAAAKTKSHSKPQPTISSISPRNLAVGETLTIRGRNFVRGRNKNSVAFKRAGGATIYVKASKSTTKMMQVTLPARLEQILVVQNGVTVPTKLKLRILAVRFGKSFTAGATAPMVFPPAPTNTGSGSGSGSGSGAGGGTTDTAYNPNGDCDGDGIINSKDSDADNDGLPNDLEKVLGTDPCKYDTDGDGVSDGYEYQSAVDLNDNGYVNTTSIMPAPTKRPYPNPLYPDANVDYDGDSLTLGQEFSLWKASRDPSKGLNDLSYSDGNQYSAYKRDGAGHSPGSLVGPDPEDKYRQFISWAQGAGYWNIQVPKSSSINGVLTLTPTQLNDFNLDGSIRTTYNAAAHIPSESRWYDFDGDGKLSDDERDEDADGLSNYDEATGRMQPAYWNGCYTNEKPYTVAYDGTSMTDPDTDGDGVRDGADDQDHDNIPNLMEMSRLESAYGLRSQDAGCGSSLTSGNPSPAEGFVNPFNPCLPYVYSKTCERHPDMANLPAPFDSNTPIYMVFN